MEVLEQWEEASQLLTTGVIADVTIADSGNLCFLIKKSNGNRYHLEIDGSTIVEKLVPSKY